MVSLLKKSSPARSCFTVLPVEKSGVALFVGTLGAAFAPGTFEAAVDRRFHEVSLFTELLQNARSLILFLKTLEKLVNRFVFIYLNTDQK